LPRGPVKGAIMLKRSNQYAIFCYEKALEAERQAQNAKKAFDRDFWLSRQTQWLNMATRYDYMERLQGFIDQMPAFPKRPQCTACDVQMRATRHQLRPDGLMEVQCQCPHCEQQQTIVEITAQP